MKIEAEGLFVRVYDELEKLSGSQDLYGLLSCARLLRQLLGEGERLIDRANRHKGLKIRFLVTDDAVMREAGPPTVFCLLLDGLDPATTPVKADIISLKIDDFLKHKVMFVKPRDITVQDIVELAAHKSGAVHLRGTGPVQHKKPIDALDELMGGAGFGDDTFLLQLRSICRVTLRALKPLRDVCKARF